MQVFDSDATDRHPARRVWQRRLNAIFVVMLSTACLSLILEYGFYLSEQAVDILHALEIAATITVCLVKLLFVAVADHPRQYASRHWADYALIFTLVVQAFVYLELRETPEFQYLEAYGAHVSILTAYTVIVQLALALMFTLESPFFHRVLVRLKLHPARSFLLSFAVIILVGSLLLKLPKAIQPGYYLSYLDALFTATSAVCVTGLTVVDTGSFFSPFGQCIILGLIQLGGLGMFTFTAFLAMLLGRGIEQGEAEMVGTLLDVDVTTRLARTLKSILGITFGIEAAGACILYADWAGEIPGRFERAFASVFHAVSAFCNAGFSLFPDSLMQFADAPLTNLTIIGLIISGGLGFGVIIDVAAPARQPRRPLSLHTRIVLVMTSFLIIGGMGLMLLFEGATTLESAGGGQKIWISLFQSVTLRTAGFNTVDFSQLLPVTAVWMMAFMAIGGSPGSAAGGMKTTTIAVLGADAQARLTRTPFASLFHRMLTPGSVKRARMTGLLFFMLTTLFAIALCLIESGPPLPLVFETVSALGTVGLSLGITGALSSWGKLVIVAAMFIGRVGPLTVGVAVTGRDMEREDQQLGERVLIG